MIVKSTGVPRSSWPLGIVRKLLMGGDGICRAAVIESKGRRTRRCLDLLIPVEVSKSPEGLRGGVCGVEDDDLGEVEAEIVAERDAETQAPIFPLQPRNAAPPGRVRKIPAAVRA